MSWVFRVGINGFGRIRRIALRIMLERGEKFELQGINLRKADLDYMEYMVKYDSVFRRFHRNGGARRGEP